MYPTWDITTTKRGLASYDVSLCNTNTSWRHTCVVGTDFSWTLIRDMSHTS